MWETVKLTACLSTSYKCPVQIFLQPLVYSELSHQLVLGWASGFFLQRTWRKRRGVCFKHEFIFCVPLSYNVFHHKARTSNHISDNEQETNICHKTWASQSLEYGQNVPVPKSNQNSDTHLKNMFVLLKNTTASYMLEIQFYTHASCESGHVCCSLWLQPCILLPRIKLH